MNDVTEHLEAAVRAAHMGRAVILNLRSALEEAQVALVGKEKQLGESYERQRLALAESRDERDAWRGHAVAARLAGDEKEERITQLESELREAKLEQYGRGWSAEFRQESAEKVAALSRAEGLARELDSARSELDSARSELDATRSERDVWRGFVKAARVALAGHDDPMRPLAACVADVVAKAGTAAGAAQGPYLITEVAYHPSPDDLLGMTVTLQGPGLTLRIYGGDALGVAEGRVVDLNLAYDHGRAAEKLRAADAAFLNGALGLGR